MSAGLPTSCKRGRWVILGLAFPSLAFAYIDPGTGAYVVQAVLALFATIAFYISHPRQLVKGVFERFFRRGTSSDSE
ncbi:MAG: hypothetical protein ACHQDD_11605 [Steroidobacterales bacterium]